MKFKQSLLCSRKFDCDTAELLWAIAMMKRTRQKITIAALIIIVSLILDELLWCWWEWRQFQSFNQREMYHVPKIPTKCELFLFIKSFTWAFLQISFSIYNWKLISVSFFLNIYLKHYHILRIKWFQNFLSNNCFTISHLFRTRYSARLIRYQHIDTSCYYTILLQVLKYDF